MEPWPTHNNCTLCYDGAAPVTPFGRKETLQKETHTHNARPEVHSVAVPTPSCNEIKSKHKNIWTGYVKDVWNILTQQSLSRKISISTFSGSMRDLSGEIVSPAERENPLTWGWGSLHAQIQKGTLSQQRICAFVVRPPGSSGIRCHGWWNLLVQLQLSLILVLDGCSAVWLDFHLQVRTTAKSSSSGNFIALLQGGECSSSSSFSSPSSLSLCCLLSCSDCIVTWSSLQARLLTIRQLSCHHLLLDPVPDSAVLHIVLETRVQCCRLFNKVSDVTTLVPPGQIYPDSQLKVAHKHCVSLFNSEMPLQLPKNPQDLTAIGALFGNTGNTDCGCV